MSQVRVSGRRARWRTLAGISGATLIVLAMLACSLTGGTSLAPEETFLPPLATPSPTTELTATPLPPLAILVAPQGDPTGGSLESVVEELSAEAGLRYANLPELPADLAGVKVDLVFVVSPIENLPAMVESAPETQFIAVGLPDLSPGANLTVIGRLLDRSDDVAFLAGYVAALVSSDWRVASLSQPEGPLGATTRLAFANGVEYLCGLCRPVHPPYPGYPLDYRLPSPGDQEAVQSLLTEVQRDRVEVIFVQPGAENPQLMNALAESGIRLVTVGAAEPSAARIASIQGDPAEAVRSVWPLVVEGASGGSVALPLRVVVEDSTRLTPGRLQHLQAVLDDLERGFIDTGVDPLTGNPD